MWFFEDWATCVYDMGSGLMSWSSGKGWLGAICRWVVDGFFVDWAASWFGCGIGQRHGVAHGWIGSTHCTDDGDDCSAAGCPFDGYLLSTK